MPGRVHDERHRHEHVVVQVVADGQVGVHLDAVLAQVRGRADAGQHQQLRRTERARRQHHFLRRPDRPRPLLGDELDARGATLLDHHAADGLARDHGQVGEPVVVEVADGRAVAQPLVDALLEDADALLLLAVVVVVPLHPGRLGQRLDERLRRRRQVALPGHLDGAAGAAQLGGAVLPVLHALVAGEDVVVAPAVAAVRSPVVVVLAVPRTNSIPLIDPEPPRTLPRVCGIFRSSACFCGSL